MNENPQLSLMLPKGTSEKESRPLPQLKIVSADIFSSDMTTREGAIPL